MARIESRDDRRRSAPFRISSPLALTITSPGAMPAREAGESGTTSSDRAGIHRHGDAECIGSREGGQVRGHLVGDFVTRGAQKCAGVCVLDRFLGRLLERLTHLGGGLGDFGGGAERPRAQGGRRPGRLVRLAVQLLQPACALGVLPFDLEVGAFACSASSGAGSAMSRARTASSASVCCSPARSAWACPRTSASCSVSSRHCRRTSPSCRPRPGSVRATLHTGRRLRASPGASPPAGRGSLHLLHHLRQTAHRLPQPFPRRLGLPANLPSCSASCDASRRACCISWSSA